MSASPIARQAVESKAIPIRRIVVDDPADLPSHLSSTPGGTLFSTTPGGTRIVYEKSFLLSLRNSPISKTPPKINIPEHLVPGSGSPPKKNSNSLFSHSSKSKNQRTKSTETHDDQFQIDL